MAQRAPPSSSADLRRQRSVSSAESADRRLAGPLVAADVVTVWSGAAATTRAWRRLSRAASKPDRCRGDLRREWRSGWRGLGCAGRLSSSLAIRGITVLVGLLTVYEWDEW